MQTTTNYKLKKPEGTDVVDIQNFNDNSDIIDHELKAHATSLSDMKQQQTTNTDNIATNTSNITGLKKKKIYCGNVDATSTSTSYKASSGISGLAYEDGMEITFIPNIDSGLNPTFQMDSLTSYPILDHKGIAPTLAKIKANVPITIVRVGSNFFIRGGGDYDVGDAIDYQKLQLISSDVVGVSTTNSLTLGASDSATCIVLDKDENFIYTLGNTTIRKISLATLTVVWTVTGTFTGNTLVVGVDGVYYGSQPFGTKLTKLNLSTGAVLWTLTETTGSFSLDYDANILYKALDTSMKKVNTSTGASTVLFTIKSVTDGMYFDGQYFYVNGGSTLYKYNITGTLIWTSQSIGSSVEKFVVKDGYTYVAGTSAIVKVDNSNGYVIYRSSTGNTTKTGISIVNNFIVATDSSYYMKIYNNLLGTLLNTQTYSYLSAITNSKISDFFYTGHMGTTILNKMLIGTANNKYTIIK